MDGEKKKEGDYGSEEGDDGTQGALLKKGTTGSVSVLPDVKFEDKPKGRISKRRLLLIIVMVLFVFGLIMLIVGIVLMSRTPQCDASDGKAKPQTNMCEPSEEMKSSGLYTFLEELKEEYYKLFPYAIGNKRPVTVEEIRKTYKAHDPTPANKKRITDKCMELLKKAEDLKVDRMKLKPREAKALSQAIFSVKYMFGHPYDTNYYAGDYMLGPNLWCAWQPICTVGHYAAVNLRYFRPNTTKDMEVVRDKLAEIKTSFTQYIENLRYGVKAGMVRSIEECKAGIDGLTDSYRNIAFDGVKGIFKEHYMSGLLHPAFLSSLINNTKEANLWASKYGTPVNESLRTFILNYVGTPINELFRYLRNEHMQHCAPSSVSSGLATLPLPYVYVNGTADKNRPTTKKLPTGEDLNGKRSYEMIVGYFTTNDYTPDQIYDLGYNMLNKLYPEVLSIARKLTEQSDNDAAKRLFTKIINSTDYYYNKEPFPVNESDKNAQKVCSNVKNARKYCPKRWEAIEKWFAQALKSLGLLDPKTIKMFYFTGPKNTAPNCPIKVGPDFNPSASASYQGAGSSCVRSCTYNIPFFTEWAGPIWEEMSTSAHEGRPGHHTQAQGLSEHFRDPCGGVIAWIDNMNYFTAFGEGWGLYAENPLIGSDTDVYKERPLDKYGMLKWQVWRALRLIVDSGYHYKGTKRDKALELFKDFAWETGAFAGLENTRYQSAFGQATSYMVGQQQIIKLREYVKKELGDKKFNLKEFHFQLLRQGSAPLNHLKYSIEQFVSCAKDKSKSGCQYYLDPPVRRSKPMQEKGVEGGELYETLFPVTPLRPKHYH